MLLFLSNNSVKSIAFIKDIDLISWCIAQSKNCMWLTVSAQCGNYGNLLLLFLAKNFVKVMSLLNTVWKNTLKRYHAEKISVKPHNKNLWNLILQMDDFLSLWGISGWFTLNEFLRLLSMFSFILKNFFELVNNF